jgi:CHAT domain-containing protein
LLDLGNTLERQLAGGEMHEYLVQLQAGQYAQLLLGQHSINVAVACLGPDGHERFASDSHSLGDTEIAELIADVSGDFRFRITAPQKTDPRGRYDITLAAVEPADASRHARVEAARAWGRAMTLVQSSTLEGALKAIPDFEIAAARWDSAGDRFEVARTLSVIGVCYMMLSKPKEAFEYAERALAAAKASGSRRIEAWALANTGVAYNVFGDKKQAIKFLLDALSGMREVRDVAGESYTLNALGRACAESGESRKALEHFRAAEKAASELQNRYQIGLIAGNMGVTYDLLGEQQQSIRSHERSLALYREVQNAGAEANALNNIGSAYQNVGEYQKALDSYTTALEINRRLDVPGRTATNLHNIASVYSAFGNPRRALKFYEEALALLRPTSDQWSLGNTVNNMGKNHADLGDCRTALKFYAEALSYRRAVSDADGEAVSLTNTGRCYATLGETDKAREALLTAVAIARRTGYRHRLAVALRATGAIQRSGGDFGQALESLNEAVEISRAIHDRKGEGETLGEIARVERDRGNLERARERAGEALAALESVRLGIVSPSLRASLIASTHGVRELEIDVLLQLHARQPDGGFAATALAANEQARARSLIEMLHESRAEIRRGVDPALLARERELQSRISAKAEMQTRLLSRKPTDVQAAAIDKELNELAMDLEQAQSHIRAASPQYAALMHPAPLDLRGIQTKVLDDDTVLLEYALGADRSYLWAVTPASIDVFDLPSRAEVTSAARRVYDLLTERNRRPGGESAAARAARLRQADEAYLAAARNASRMLLGPAAALLCNKRLLIVADGILQYLPFGALLAPGADRPLIVDHEVVTSPSASVVAVLRQEAVDRRPATKTLAVLADPVFSVEDPRIDPFHSVGHRPAPDRGAGDWTRLRFSRTEAGEIARLAGEDSTFAALDFDASRETAMRPELADYRIIHFATHSMLNNNNPELSGVVLSLVDATGRPRNGYLRLYDIYNLRLNADLVVLSACRTALGEEIQGEGLVGLTRGFLYAGAARVAATLWEVDDRATGEVMKRFYQRMLARGERPAAALRAAQIELWKNKGWEAPYYWAAFTLQGEWR